MTGLSPKAMWPCMIWDGVIWLWPNYDSRKWVLCYTLVGLETAAAARDRSVSSVYRRSAVFNCGPQWVRRDQANIFLCAILCIGASYSPGGQEDHAQRGGGGWGARATSVRGTVCNLLLFIRFLRLLNGQVKRYSYSSGISSTAINYRG